MTTIDDVRELTNHAKIEANKTEQLRIGNIENEHRYIKCN